MGHRMRKFLLATAFGLAGGLIASAQAQPQPQLREVPVAEGAFSRGEPVPSWADLLPIPPEAGARPVVVRLADQHHLVAETPAVFVNRAVQVNDASALGDIGQFHIHFVPEYNRLKLHAVRVLRGAQTIDKTQTVNLRFLQRETALEAGVYSGVVTAVAVVDDLRVGDTLHVMYSVEGANPVFGGRYSAFASWDNTDPIKLRRVTLNYPNHRQIQWKLVGESGGAPLEPESSEANGMRRLRFVGRDLRAVELEAQLPDGYHAFRLLQFSEYKSWQEVARWALPLFKPSAQLSDEALSLVERLRALPSREARISAALQWVQSDIRYFSVSLGESSHRPYAPEIVLARRYGDCKDKSLLLISLLHQLGIDARPAFVASSAKSMPQSLLPTPLAFDHVIVEVNEGQRFFLDPTLLGQRGRLARMGQRLEGAQALVVRADTTDLTKIETPNIRDLVKHEVDERITLAELSGEGMVEIRKTYNGAQAEAVRVMLPKLSAAQLRKFSLQGFERRYPDANLISEPEFLDDVDGNSIVVVARLKSDKVSFATKDRWLVPITAPNFTGAFPMPDVLKRSLPLGMPTHPYEARYTLEVLWPENVSAMRDPFTDRVENKHFSFVRKGSFRGNRARYEFALRTRSDSLDPADVLDTLNDIKKVGNMVSGNIFLARSDMREVIRFTRRSLQDTLRARLQESVERTSRTIAGGGLSGGDLAEALCSRSETYAELGKTAEAIEDGKEAVRVTPNSPDALACRANAFWHSGQFEHAIADYSRALSLGHSQFRSFYRRGHARFYLGKLEEAAMDFEKAVATGDGDKLYAELWLAWTLKRLGRELPPDLVERARADARGAWPRPALAMLAGALPPEEVLKELERLKGDEREMALTEGWFYIGQNYLSNKQAGAAREAFAKAREKGVIVYIEHVAAGFELGKIKSD
jgi:lipoprotein NlpI/transglutaminase-like putative cysteine protease